MYRDELAAFRERYDAARRAVDQAAEKLAEQVELIDVLRHQLEERGLTAPDAPEVEPVRELAEAEHDTRAVELARLAADAERYVGEIHARRDELSRLAQLLNRRLGGEDVTLPLCPPNRTVPWAYLLAEASPFWALGGLVAACVGMLALTDQATTGLLILCVGGTLTGLAATRALLRMRFLVRCREAVSTHVATSASDGSSMTNWPVRVSEGWDVRVESYTGRGQRAEVEFLTHDGRTGRVVCKGSGYDGGVILYAPDTMKAFDVKHLACCPRPGPDGRWSGKLGFRLWLRVLLYVGLLLSLFVLTVCTVTWWFA